MQVNQREYVDLIVQSGCKSTSWNKSGIQMNPSLSEDSSKASIGSVVDKRCSLKESVIRGNI